MIKTQSKVQRSLDLYHKAEQLIPGRTQLISRRGEQFRSSA